jgi:hypothetical protein
MYLFIVQKHDLQIPVVFERFFFIAQQTSKNDKAVKKFQGVHLNLIKPYIFHSVKKH